MSDIERRLRRVEAVQDIMRLKAVYAKLADGKYTDRHEKKPQAELDEVAWQQALCFTEDGEFLAGPFGTAIGRKAIFENFRTKPFRFALHVYATPIIDIGESNLDATGQWVLWMMATEHKRGTPIHMAGYNRDSYVYHEGRWLFRRVEVETKFVVPFSEPWSPHPMTLEP